MYNGFEELFPVLAGLGIIMIIFLILGVAMFVAEIILLCLSIKEKGLLKINGIDEAKIKKIGSLSIWSLIITIFSCVGCTFIVFPILALVFANSNAKTALKAGNIVEAAKKADLALIMLIIGNAVVVGSTVLGSIVGLLEYLLKIN